MANNTANGPTPSKGAAKGTVTAENTNMHKLLKMGQSPKVEVGGSKKTPA